MNVRIVPREFPRRTDLYGGIGVAVSDGRTLRLYELNRDGTEAEFCVEPIRIPLSSIAEILTDNEPGDWW